MITEHGEGLPMSIIEVDRVCTICGEPFTQEEWTWRHTAADGEDCHDRCCDLCADSSFFEDEYTWEWRQ